MQENNFEKQVQQKLDELTLKPSEEVWQKVALGITKRTGSRRIYALLFLLLLFISSVIFVLWDEVSDKKISKVIADKSIPAKTNQINEPAGNSNKNQLVGTSDSPKDNRKDTAAAIKMILSDKPVNKKISHQQQPLPVHVVANSITSFEGKKNTVDSKNKKVDVPTNLNKVNFSTRQQTTTTIRNGNTTDLENTNIDSTDAMISRVGKEIPVIIDEVLKGTEADSAGKDQIIKKLHQGNTLAVSTKIEYKNEVGEKKSNQLKSNRQWKVGVSFSLGVATTQNGYLGIIGSGTSGESKAFVDLAQSTSGNPSQATSISRVPSKIKVGKGLVLGVFVEKNGSPKTIFHLGLNYKRYNSSMMIGNRVDSSTNYSQVNFFYRNGNSRVYKNYFHFLELPVALRYKLGKQNKAPVYLNTGISIAQLVGSNALQFDTLSGAYFSNNTAFNKTQVTVSAGILFSLFGHAKNPILIGPDINFSLNKMANSGYYKNRHYSYFGILVQKSIGKK